MEDGRAGGRCINYIEHGLAREGRCIYIYIYPLRKWEGPTERVVTGRAVFCKSRLSRAFRNGHFCMHCALSTVSAEEVVFPNPDCYPSHPPPFNPSEGMARYDIVTLFPGAIGRG